MSESILKSILEESARLEWDKYENVPEHKFSLKHRLAMKRIFKLYEKNTREIHSATISNPKRFRLTRKTVLTAIVIVFLAALAGCTAAYFISQSFRGDVHKEFTRIFPKNTENCPTTIEEKYYLPEVPEGFEVLETDSTPYDVYTSYKNFSTGETITLRQFVKTDFSPIHFNTEKCDFQEVDINGHCALLLDYRGVGEKFSGVIWDNGDYVIELCGNLYKNQIIDLAKTTKVSENIK
ncbi:MAG: DUF4367 domain-containing protein [Oscillospiraceae bacterium]|nr:DUF4367 domain-containing protein [Oscillospiraceae bacterium]